ARRAGFANVRSLVWNGSDVPVFPKEIISRGGFHRVLVDAPCSASGTWRRNPDARFRINDHGLEELNILQRKILSAASQTVRPGGLLVYATCSFIAGEDEDIVEDFLSSRSGFELLSSSIFGNPACDADTTFCAVMKRK
ncbi:MAG: RsmB/NOP family class I SAM-dependent RNA methyltransferase, partial [Spirochaetota bacterium]